MVVIADFSFLLERIKRETNIAIRERLTIITGPYHAQRYFLSLFSSHFKHQKSTFQTILSILSLKHPISSTTLLCPVISFFKLIITDNIHGSLSFSLFWLLITKNETVSLFVLIYGSKTMVLTGPLSWKNKKVIKLRRSLECKKKIRMKFGWTHYMFWLLHRQNSHKTMILMLGILKQSETKTNNFKCIDRTWWRWH